MVADTRFEITRPLRAAIATVLHPIEACCSCRWRPGKGGSDYLMGCSTRSPRKAAKPPRPPGRARRPLSSSCRRRTTGCARWLGLRPALTVRSHGRRGALRRARSVLAQGRHRPRRHAGRGAGLAGDQRRRRARPGDARLPAVLRGDAAGRQGRGRFPVLNAATSCAAPPSARATAWSCASWPAMPTCRWATCSPPRAWTASTRPVCRWRR